MPLFILPFDHRSGFAKDLLGVPYPYASEAHRARAAQLKELIYDAFLAVRNTSKNPDDFGILVDYETGKQVIADARDEGVMTIVSTEKSGEELSLLYEDETGAFLKMIGASYGKSLVKWKQVPETGDEQIKTLAELQANLDAVEIPHLIEPLFMIDPTERCAALLKTVELVHDAGVHPEVWKVEGLQSEAEWQRRSCPPFLVAPPGGRPLGSGNDSPELR